MFRHRGKARTFRHNFRLAAFLSFTAGIVNICGVLALGILTTNVTGHFAYFAEAVANENVWEGINFLFYILAFLAGSFASGFMTEYFTARGRKAPHSAAMFCEIFLLLVIGLLGNTFIKAGISKSVLACVLLFAMGLQNSLVSSISNAAVRTTHLTGLFTDLGIELSQLFFFKEPGQRSKLLHSIKLRCGIIAFFFCGCAAGGYLYLVLKFKILIIAALIIAFALVYDNLRMSYYRVQKRLHTGDVVK